MSFFEGDEAWAIVKVPEEFAQAIESASGTDYIGTVVNKNNKTVKISHFPNNFQIDVQLRTTKVVRNYKMDIKPKKDLTVILDEKKDELKVSKVVKYEGNVFANRK